MTKPCNTCKYSTGSRALCYTPKNGISKRYGGIKKNYIWVARKRSWLMATLFNECGKRGRWWESKV